MKFTNNNCALHFLHPAAEMACSTTHKDEDVAYALQYLYNSFPKKRERFSEKIRFVTEPFYNAYLKSRKKLEEVMLKEPLNQNGTLLIKTPNGGIHTFFYDFEAKFIGENLKVEGVMFIFFKERKIPEPALVNFFFGENEDYREYSSGKSNQENLTIGVLVELMMFLTFLKNCPVETKTITAGHKLKKGPDKFVNETKSTIEILDSHYFTTTVREAGFWVGQEEGGFWRLQPYGPGLTERRWTWINPFQKEGYTRKAKVLTENE